jgi:hypothetical protein
MKWIRPYIGINLYFGIGKAKLKVLNNSYYVFQLAFKNKSLLLVLTNYECEV